MPRVSNGVPMRLRARSTERVRCASVMPLGRTTMT